MQFGGCSFPLLDLLFPSGSVRLDSSSLIFSSWFFISSSNAVNDLKSSRLSLDCFSCSSRHRSRNSVSSSTLLLPLISSPSINSKLSSIPSLFFSSFFNCSSRVAILFSRFLFSPLSSGQFPQVLWVVVFCDKRWYSRGIISETQIKQTYFLLKLCLLRYFRSS